MSINGAEIRICSSLIKCHRSTTAHYINGRIQHRKAVIALDSRVKSTEYPCHSVPLKNGEVGWRIVQLWSTLDLICRSCNTTRYKHGYEDIHSEEMHCASYINTNQVDTVIENDAPVGNCNRFFFSILNVIPISWLNKNTKHNSIRRIKDEIAVRDSYLYYTRERKQLHTD